MRFGPRARSPKRINIRKTTAFSEMCFFNQMGNYDGDFALVGDDFSGAKSFGNAYFNGDMEDDAEADGEKTDLGMVFLGFWGWFSLSVSSRGPRPFFGGEWAWFFGV